MPSRLVVVIVAGLIIPSLLLPLAYSQTRQPGAVYDFDRKGENPGPAPRRDLSGIWVPAAGSQVGIQADGAQLKPSRGRPQDELPFTPLGRKTWMARKPSVGVTAVNPALTDDPVKGGVTGAGCDPVGFPRLALWNLRAIRLIQSPENVVVLYMLNNKWRVIRTDGWQLPADPADFDEPRFHGYSAGRWEDDFTFVAQSAGFDERTWIDAAGRPHSDMLRVEERYHRVDREHLVLSVTIEDPVMYTQPWQALKMSLRLQSPTFDIPEMECVPSETHAYNQLIARPAGNIKEPN
jgi:hypothetical protein